MNGLAQLAYNMLTHEHGDCLMLSTNVMLLREFSISLSSFTTVRGTNLNSPHVEHIIPYQTPF
jgi:hypothetical protein